MPGGVDQVEIIGLPVFGDVVHVDGGSLDGDALFFFEFHVVEHLRGHVAVCNRVGELQQAVSEGGLAVVDMGDDGEVSNILAHEIIFCLPQSHKGMISSQRIRRKA